MSSAGGNPREAQFADLLATYDAALARGLALPSPPTLDADLRRRASDARATLRQLEAIWPRDDADWFDESTALGPTGGSEPTQAAAGAPARLGRFVILEEVGRGGFGVVFRAVDPSLGREVALKVPRPETLLTPEMRSRFLLEARAAARLDHPNVVPIHEAGELGPICYIASAFCEGPTLAGWLKGRTGPIPAILAARLIATLADAVQHSHERGILHRDLKPSNILLQASGRGQSGPISGLDNFDVIPRITDFGLAKILDESEHETRSGLPIGSPSYMAPEQAEGRPSATGPATDVHALGTILYELVAGQPPFRGSSILETLERVRSTEPEPPSRLRPSLPRDLETICLHCLRKDPNDRYPAASALADDLRRFLDGEPILARPDGPASRARRWCLRPERVRNAGTVVMIVSLTMATMAASGFPAIEWGLVKFDRPWDMKINLIGWIFGLYLPTAWVGWKMTRHLPWASGIGLAFCLAELSLIVLSMVGMPWHDLGGGLANEPTARWPSEIVFLSLFLVEATACGVALISTLANREGVGLNTA